MKEKVRKSKIFEENLFAAQLYVLRLRVNVEELLSFSYLVGQIHFTHFMNHQTVQGILNIESVMF